MNQQDFLKQADERFTKAFMRVPGESVNTNDEWNMNVSRFGEYKDFLTSLIQERDRQWSEALTDIFRKENPYLWNAFVISDSEGWKAAVRNMNKIIKQMV